MKNHKNEKIHKAIHENDRKINLHEIKAQTGAGNGHKNSNIVNLINNISNNISLLYFRIFSLLFSSYCKW